MELEQGNTSPTLQPQVLGLPETVGEGECRPPGKKHREEVSYLLSGCLILFLRVCIRVWFHMEVPAIELHNVPIFHMRQDLG